MAAIGLRYCVYAALTEDDEAGTHSYETGKYGRKLINANISINKAQAPLYADDRLSENSTEFIDGDLTIGKDELTDVLRQDWLGNTTGTITVGENEVTEVRSNDTDIAPYIGLGFIQSKIVDNNRKYRAIFLTKVQFGEPNETAETKGQNLAWQTPSITGKIFRRNDGIWKEEATFDTLAAATAYLKMKVDLV